jgi:putative transposase
MGHARYSYRIRVSAAAERALLSEWDACRWVWNHDWLREGSSVAQQRAGMPQFRKRGKSQPTMNYTRRDFKLRDGKLTLVGGITVRVVWSRELPSVPSSVRVYRDALGHWHASFVVEAATQPLPETGAVLGVDWGVKEIATTTDPAYDLPHPQFGRKAADGLRELRCESQAPPAAVRAHLHLHRLRHLVP